jgi:hypothetical protein
MAEKESSFIAGLIGGIGETMIDAEREKKAQKLKTLGVLIDNPDVDDQSRQKALDELVALSGLSPKGKGSEAFHRARGMLEGVVNIGRGIVGAHKKIQGQGGGQQGQQPPMSEELGMPPGTKITPQGGSLGPMPQRGQAVSPYRLKTHEQIAGQEQEEELRKMRLKQFGEREEEAAKRQLDAADRNRRRQVAKEYGISGAAAAEFEETGRLSAGMMGKVTQGKDAYENPPGSGHWVRDIIDSQSGEVVGQVPAQSPVKPSRYDQEADALLRAGTAKTPEEAYQMATDRVYTESKKKVDDINSKISARTSSVEARNQGLRDLTKAEKEEIDSLKTELNISSRSLDRERSLRQKEGTTERKKTHDEEMSRLADDIDDLQKRISEKLASVQVRSAPLPQGNGKELTDEATIRKFFEAAGGDPAKAQQLAEKNGWKVTRK